MCALGHVRPVGDFMHAGGVLPDDRVADIGEFTIFKDEKVVLFRDRL